MNGFEFLRIGVVSEQKGPRPSLHDCIEAVLPLADAMLLDVLDGLKGVVSKQTFNSAFSGPVPLNKSMTDLLCGQGQLVTEMFVVELQSGVYGSSPTDIVTESMTNLAELELLSDEQIDASIEFALALQEVSRGVDDVLPVLDGLVSSVSGWTTVQPSLNPLKVEVFVKALLACLKRFVPDSDIRSVLLIPTADLLGVNLRKFYLEICEWLRSHGVEPSWPIGNCLGGESIVVARGLSNSVGRTLATFGRMRQLLAGHATGNFDGGGQEFLPTLPFSYVALEELKLIKPMMQRLSQRGNRTIESEISPDMLDQGASGEQASLRQLSRQLGEEVVRLMLDKLIQHERLLPGVRSAAAELEPVLLDIAGADPRYFSDRQHPARLVLDWLVYRGLSFESEGDPGFARFLQSVANAVDVLRRPGVDAARFSTVLGNLQADWTLGGQCKNTWMNFEPQTPVMAPS